MTDCYDNLPFVPFHFEEIQGENVDITAVKLLSEQGLIIQKNTVCGGCVDHRRPRMPRPEETGPFLCDQHQTTLFMCCEDPALKPVCFQTHDSQTCVIQTVPTHDFEFDCAPRGPLPEEF